MARIARVVVPGIPHHVTQRGNRRQTTFFNQDDYQAYIALMAQWCAHHAVAVWAYCLMPNHTHLIMVPPSEDALRRAIGEAHRRYTRAVNFREGWRGHLWQGRFASFPMDERYLLAAARYVEFNPVRAQLVERPQDYPWSSARAHLDGRDDALVKVAPLLDLVGDWKTFISTGTPEDDRVSIRQHEHTGRPLGSEGFIARIEREADRILRKQKPGPKDNNQRNQDRLN
jgi:putative transposase